ncbi:MAG: glutaredoxin family protein [Candidatus Accumulibacter sp.]|jgi:Glutaredoxin.|uniref:glutaredoxin family protein n=1 Tax=Accumulibacter sp. TaxID=2053492 RepID=UPI001A3CFF6B|nr:glutaredoxin family protein [Accumulibacter sp.]MBL8367763.1 glutaredoxin family protein [Accumulibacter sp.]HRI91247.1 glutaredoxin family protein [Accumulibacter sp.]
MHPTTAVRFAAIAAALLAASAVNAQQTYRWIDARSGVTVISDRPPPPGTPGVTVSEGANAGEDEQRLPYAIRQASARFPVVLYTSADCGACQQARVLLNGRGVPFVEKLLTSQDELTALGRQLGGDAVLPSISVGRQSATGFTAASWNELLDFAGYPATAPYGFKPAGPPRE